MYETEEEDRPWEQAGSLRRDCEPERGAWLNLLANIALIAGVGSCMVAAPAVIGLPLGLVIWQVARRDLAEMRAGIRDRKRIGRTARARDTGLAAVLTSLLWVAFYSALVTYLWMAR